MRLLNSQVGWATRVYRCPFGFIGDMATSTIAHCSSDEKARLVLALLVWQRPNVLLLDEPTNHLDLDMRQALTLTAIKLSRVGVQTFRFGPD